ncbi:DUF3000 family protein, partial [Streptomyces lydicus]|uniref:DUF3000 family protein n=1 Tax=Streptomyces lydicus TaxID=47763 RepID=UPI0036A66228
MAAAHEHLADGADEAPIPFRQAVEALRAARLRPEIEIDPTPAPKRLAPYAYALEAAVVERGSGPGGEDKDLADGRLVVLHNPAGDDTWQGTFRVVTLARAELEPEMGADPLLPEVSWSWLTGALDARGVRYGAPSGTVTRAGSHYFGGGGAPGGPRVAPLAPRAAPAPRQRLLGPPGAGGLGAQVL